MNRGFLRDPTVITSVISPITSGAPTEILPAISSWVLQKITPGVLSEISQALPSLFLPEIPSGVMPVIPSTPEIYLKIHTDIPQVSLEKFCQK